MQTHEALEALRGAAQALRSSQHTTAGGGGSSSGPLPLDTVPHQPAPSASHMLLQISALHKAFLALSDAFTEEMTQRQVEQEQQHGALQSVRRECAGKLQLAAALQAEVQQLAADGQQAHSAAVLAQRCAQLEQEVDRLGQELEEQRYGASKALQAAVEGAVARQLAEAQRQWVEQQLPALAAAAAERAAQGWEAVALPLLLQPVQETVAATAELAGSLAADMSTLAREAEQLRASHQNHEQRLRHTQERVMAAASSPAGAAAGLQQLQQQVQAVQSGHSRLDEALQQVSQRQREQEQQVGQRRLQQQQWADAARGGGEDEQLQQQLQGALQELESLSLAVAELPAMQQQLVAVAKQQAQQARSSQDLVQSVATDVRSLARHTKALDKEVRGLTSVTKQTQQALLQSCSVFSKALGCPSPVGPFTSFPPQL